MSRIKKVPTNLACPQGASNEEYAVRLSQREMQCIANAVAGFYNVMSRERAKVSPEQTAIIGSALDKMNQALKGDIVVVN